LLSNTRSQRLYIFRFYAALAAALGGEALQPLLVPMLHPLHRVTAAGALEKNGAAMC
jgi:hypothetical protein